ncbi:Pyrimidodiazepine synthase [Grifola frondosa]|uniref:Pyrimidodiazepine synthase n=1 Tax=Grifola frondosa TaxID=5627 RepID=A0A1C7MK63_GRIFR|nr:Pyrimidodiazepine synthase [Grifola frondosa]
MPEQITLYTAKICPYAHRVELALEEARAKYTKFQIDLQNKPQWYAPQVNPASKVPAIAYGGPQVPPDQPSPDSIKLAESLVLLEFVSDLYPDSGLLPKDPVLRAKARFFIDAVSTKLVPAWGAYFSRHGPVDDFLKAIETIQALLPESGFAIGPYSIADAALTPHLARLRVSLKNDLGTYAEGEGQKTLQILSSDRFARFARYYKDLVARENFKATFDEEYVTDVYKKRFANLRTQGAGH